MENLLQYLHDCEINGSLEWFYDGSWMVRLGDLLNGVRAEAVVGSEQEALEWLDAKAQEIYPHYARRRAN